MIELKTPSLALLPRYVDALRRGWTPDHIQHVLGHLGYAVVPWKRGQGHATQAVRALLLYARAQGLPYVEITTDPDNFASQKVIAANGGVLVESFTKPAAFGKVPGLRFRISL